MVGKHIHHESGPYYIRNVEIRSRAVFTNLPVTGAMRDYGVPQIAFAVELQMDALAENAAAEAILLKLKELVEREKETEPKAKAEGPKATEPEAGLQVYPGERRRGMHNEAGAVVRQGEGAGGLDEGREKRDRGGIPSSSRMRGNPKTLLAPVGSRHLEDIPDVPSLTACGSLLHHPPSRAGRALGRAGSYRTLESGLQIKEVVVDGDSWPAASSWSCETP